MLITQGLQRLMGCILPTMLYRSQHCWELLHPFAHHCQHARNNSQHCCASNVACVCTQPKNAGVSFFPSSVVPKWWAMLPSVPSRDRGNRRTRIVMIFLARKRVSWWACGLILAMTEVMQEITLYIFRQSRSRFMFIWHSKPIKSQVRNRHNKK